MALTERNRKNSMIPALILVRTGSTRMPGKCLMNFGEGNVLQHVIRRCLHSQFTPYVCTTTSEGDDILEALADKEGAEVYRGAGNPNERVLQAANWHKITAFHTIDCDDPFFCPHEVRRSMEYMNQQHLFRCLPTKLSANEGLGLMGCGYNLKGQNTGVLGASEIKYPKSRVTLDYQEDYWMLRTLVRLGCDHRATRVKVDEILWANPALASVNYFRNEDWRLWRAA